MIPYYELSNLLLLEVECSFKISVNSYFYFSNSSPSNSAIASSISILSTVTFESPDIKQKWGLVLMI